MKPARKSSLRTSPEYRRFIGDLKARVATNLAPASYDGGDDSGVFALHDGPLISSATPESAGERGELTTKRVYDSSVTGSSEYRNFITDLKARVEAARASAARAVNRELILLYWDIGRAIVEKQRVLGWGESVVEIVAADLRRAFPGVRGFSPFNIWRMRQLYSEYTAPDFLAHAMHELQKVGRLPRRTDSRPEQPNPPEQTEFLAQAVPETGNSISIQFLQGIAVEVPWGHHVEVMKKVKDPAARLFYLRSTARLGWTRNVLLNQIKAGAYERSVTERKTHNFAAALPEQLAAQADEMLQSTYNLEFLGIRRAVTERNLEERLISRLQSFLLELGYGFCFIGRQYRLALGQKEYFIDLLFYHRHLRALVAFDLKLGAFEPEHAGKMDFYLNLLNDTERAPDDRPSLGIILCTEKDDVEVEYALRAKKNQIGVAVYELQSTLPAELKGMLPSARQLADVVREALPERRAK